jgi:hypothetical protein
MINLTWALFSIAGSFYDPLVMFFILTFSVAVIITCWRPQVKLGENPS